MSRIALQLIVTLLACSAVKAAPAAAAQRRPTQTWAARSSSGLTLGGAWSATEDAKTGAVAGAWTVVDAKGQIVAQGGWSATKSAAGWTGIWRAAVAGRSGEYSGTWTASVDLNPDARFSELFAKAAEDAVSGTWGTGGQSGSWTIRVYK